MEIKVVPLTRNLLTELSPELPVWLHRSYFSVDSVAYCMLADSKPVFAGGIVSMGMKRGEIWMLATDFYHAHVKTCYKHIRYMVSLMAHEGCFRRVQATCDIATSTLLFQHLGFRYEGVMQAFGPNGETCYLFARIFE